MSAQNSKPPIEVELSPLEKQGYDLAGTAPDENVETQIEIVLVTAGMDGPSAAFMSRKLGEAALAARTRIREATAFTIKVVAPEQKGGKTKKKSPKRA